MASTLSDSLRRRISSSLLILLLSAAVSSAEMNAGAVGTSDFSSNFQFPKVQAEKLIRSLNLFPKHGANDTSQHNTSPVKESMTEVHGSSGEESEKEEASTVVSTPTSPRSLRPRANMQPPKRFTDYVAK